MHSEELARVHQEAFEANPLAYDPSRVSVGRGPLLFTDALCAEHLDYLAAPILQGGKANTPQHCATVRQSLMWWRMQLRQVNLRALTVEELRARIPVCPGREVPDDQLDEAAGSSTTSWRLETVAQVHTRSTAQGEGASHESLCDRTRFRPIIFIG